MLRYALSIGMMFMLTAPAPASSKKVEPVLTYDQVMSYLYKTKLGSYPRGETRKTKALLRKTVKAFNKGDGDKLYELSNEWLKLQKKAPNSRIIEFGYILAFFPYKLNLIACEFTRDTNWGDARFVAVCGEMWNLGSNRYLLIGNKCPFRNVQKHLKCPGTKAQKLCSHGTRHEQDVWMQAASDLRFVYDAAVKVPAWQECLANETWRKGKNHNGKRR